MRTVKGYNRIQSANKLFGLEFFDLLLLLLVYLAVFIFSANLLINLVIVGSVYFVLSIYKKGKPSHWTGSVVRFLIWPKKFSTKTEKEKNIFK